MPQALEKDVFTLAWHIENFGMCPQKEDECIKTPEFVVDALDRTTWYLVLYPKGDESSDGDGVTVYLYRSNKEEEPDEVTVECDIIWIASKTEKVFTNSLPMTFAKNTGKCRGIFVITEELSGNKKALAPTDVFSLLCCMRRGTQPSEKPSHQIKVSSMLTHAYSVEEIFTLISDVNGSRKACVEHYILNTRILVERRLIAWVIKDFKTQMQSGKKIHASVFSNFREMSELLLSCYMGGDKHRSVRLDIERKDKNFNQMLMWCEVTLLGKDDVPLESKTSEHLFGESHEVWCFPTLTKFFTIAGKKYDFLIGEDLKLKCEFLISYKGEMVTTGGNYLQGSPMDPDSLPQHIRGLSNDKEFTDVILNAEGVELPVHKSLICARSPVFRKMFNRDSEEKQTGVVHITDIDLDTLKNMRDFMYEDCLPDLELEDMKRLYSAADKYEILSLKKLCAGVLKFNLTPSNVCDVLVLADLHQDADLLSDVLSFLRFHSEDVFKSREWMDLMKINWELAGETMRKLLERKIFF